MKVHHFPRRVWPYLALAAGVLIVRGDAVPLLAADAPVPASAPASQPATRPTVYMWEFLRAGVVNGQLVLTPAKSEPADSTDLPTFAGLSGAVRVQTGLRDVPAIAYRVRTEGKIRRTQIAQRQLTSLRLSDVARDTDTNAADGVVLQDGPGLVPGANVEAAARVTLVVTKTDNAMGPKDATVILKLEAASFAELCAKHPVEVGKYVEPLLRDLDLGGVFFVDLKDAQHAFAAKAPPDPAIVARVQAILPRLDDDAPDVRQAAARELAALGDAGVAPVQALDLSKLPLQTRSMLRNYLESAGAATEDPRLSNAEFLLLCLALDDKEIPALAKARLEKLRGTPVDMDIGAPVEERRMLVRKMLFDGWAGQSAPTQK